MLRAAKSFRISVVLLLIWLLSSTLTVSQYSYFRYPVWHPNENIIAVTNAASIRLFSSDFTQLLEEYILFEGSTPGLRIGHMAWSPDGTMLAVSLTGEQVNFRLQVWDLQSGQRVTEIADSVSTDVRFVWGANSDHIALVHVRDHGDHTVRIYSIPAGTLFQEFRPDYQTGIYKFNWSPERNQAVIDLGGANAGMYSLNTTTGEVSAINKVFHPEILYEYSPSGFLVAGVQRSDDSIVEIWDTEAFDVVATLIGHPSWVAAISWVDDTIIATGSEDGTTRFWNAQTGQQLALFETGLTSRPSFNSDGTLFAASAINKITYVREVEFGDVVAALGSSNTPVANASSDQTVTDSNNNHSETLTLNGSGSTDSDGKIMTYSWKENGVEIAADISPSVNLAVGKHIIRLTVTDDGGGASSDEVVIIVKPPMP